MTATVYWVSIMSWFRAKCFTTFSASPSSTVGPTLVILFKVEKTGDQGQRDRGGELRFETTKQAFNQNFLHLIRNIINPALDLSQKAKK